MTSEPRGDESRVSSGAGGDLKGTVSNPVSAPCALGDPEEPGRACKQEMPRLGEARCATQHASRTRAATAINTACAANLHNPARMVACHIAINPPPPPKRCEASQSRSPVPAALTTSRITRLEAVSLGGGVQAKRSCSQMLLEARTEHLCVCLYLSGDRGRPTHSGGRCRGMHSVLGRGRGGCGLLRYYCGASGDQTPSLKYCPVLPS